MLYLLDHIHRFINLSLLSVILGTMALPHAKAHGLNWQSHPQLPDNEGFAGSFSGTSNGVLLVAGGSNFPKKDRGKEVPKFGTIRFTHSIKVIVIGLLLVNYHALMAMESQ